MFRNFLSAAAILCTTVSFAGAGSAPDMKEGKWEISTTVEMEGMPVETEPMKDTQCLTKKNFLPPIGDMGKECKTTATKIEGNTVKWTMKCNEQAGSMESVGTITYKGDKLEGTIKTTIKDPGAGKMTLVQRMSGKRVGDCK
jgi:hypothetical protein